MSELLHQLGVDWKLLLSQGFNFLIVLLALSFLVYRPLLKVLAERRKKIELGLQAGAEAEKKLNAIDESRKEILSEADQKAMKIVSESEALGKHREQEIVASAVEKSARMMMDAQKTAEAKANEGFANLSKEASAMMRSAIAMATATDPAKVDTELIARATEGLRGAIAQK